jgi:hypothetical protein
MLILWVRVLETIVSDSHLAFPNFESQPVSHIETKIFMAAQALAPNTNDLT